MSFPCTLPELQRGWCQYASVQFEGWAARSARRNCSSGEPALHPPTEVQLVSAPRRARCRARSCTSPSPGSSRSPRKARVGVEVVEVAGGVRRAVFMVADSGQRPALRLAPARVVAVCELGRRSVGIGRVAEWDHGRVRVLIEIAAVNPSPLPSSQPAISPAARTNGSVTVNVFAELKPVLPALSPCSARAVYVPAVEPSPGRSTLRRLAASW